MPLPFCPSKSVIVRMCETKEQGHVVRELLGEREQQQQREEKEEHWLDEWKKYNPQFPFYLILLSVFLSLADFFFTSFFFSFSLSTIISDNFFLGSMDSNIHALLRLHALPISPSSALPRLHTWHAIESIALSQLTHKTPSQIVDVHFAPPSPVFFLLFLCLIRKCSSYVFLVFFGN